MTLNNRWIYWLIITSLLFTICPTYFASDNDDINLPFNSTNVKISWSPIDDIIAFSDYSDPEQYYLIIFNVSNEKTIKKIQIDHSWLLNIEWSPDGKYLAAANYDGEFIIWNSINWSILKCWTAETFGPFEWSNNNQLFAINNVESGYSKVNIYNTNTWNIVYNFSVNLLHGIAWNQEDTEIAFAEEERIVILNTQKWNIIKIINTSINIGLNWFNNFFIFGHIEDMNNATIAIFNSTTWNEISFFNITDITRLELSPTTKILAIKQIEKVSSNYNESILIIDMKNFTILSKLSYRFIYDFKWNFDGTKLAICSYDNNITIINCDGDNDGILNFFDVFPNDTTEWNDTDKDGIGDNSDAFIADPTQWLDSDNDGYGDNQSGTLPDRFPYDPSEWNDTDLDGYGDNSDRFPLDPSEWNDTDADGIGNNSDAFPLDPAASVDSDGDGYPDAWNAGRDETDSTTGLHLDAFPLDPDEWADFDGDGVSDDADAFPSDPATAIDSDNDGYPDTWNLGKSEKDSTTGLHLDAFPFNPTEWNDTDGDGVGDNTDAFPTDPAVSVDSDGDGYPDHWNQGKGPLNSTTGLILDSFPNDASEWSDRDNDGIGDNSDEYPDDPTNTPPSDDDDTDGKSNSWVVPAIATAVIGIVVLIGAFYLLKIKGRKTIVSIAPVKQNPPARVGHDQSRLNNLKNVKRKKRYN